MKRAPLLSPLPLTEAQITSAPSGWDKAPHKQAPALRRRLLATRRGVITVATGVQPGAGTAAATAVRAQMARAPAPPLPHPQGDKETSKCHSAAGGWPTDPNFLQGHLQPPLRLHARPRRWLPATWQTPSPGPAGVLWSWTHYSGAASGPRTRGLRGPMKHWRDTKETRGHQDATLPVTATASLLGPCCLSPASALTSPELNEPLCSPGCYSPLPPMWVQNTGQRSR